MGGKRKQARSSPSLAVEFVVDDGQPIPVEPPRERSTLAWLAVVAVVVSVAGVGISAGRTTAVSGRGAAVPAPKLESKAIPLQDGYLTAWRYGTPAGPLYRATGPHYLAVARGLRNQILVVSVGSRGCPTLVSKIAVYSNTEFAITEDQVAGFSGCYLDTSVITNVLIVPAMDLTKPVTIVLGTASVVLPPK